MKTARCYTEEMKTLVIKEWQKKYGLDMYHDGEQKIQDQVVRKVMKDMREECAKAADPVDESLAAVIRQIKIK